MHIGLFTTDNVVLETIFFFMTFSVVYAVVVALYEDIIIREDNISVGMVAIVLKTAYDCTLDIVTRLICLPTCIHIWTNPEIEGGKEDFFNFFGGMLMVAVGIALVFLVLGGIFFGISYLLVDSGAGYYCKAWY